MTRLWIPLTLLVALLTVPAAEAGTRPAGLRGLLAAQGGSVTVPPEWGGIWTSVDSVFDCDGNLTGVESTTDTLCAGKSIYVDQAGSPVQYDCVGSADANEIHATCTAVVTIDPCTVTYQFQIDGTRTADTFFAVTTTTIQYSGSDPLCSYLPNTCERDRMHSTRTAPEPAEYCATPARETTWGRVKTIYR